ncbi:substrate-binding periplasmic protein [Pseudoalteromonas sp. SSM20]|uniref:substrate-binding periplasmic protein n=1 Tax=Pseudoalteromonas sp. SSM20 TaxID=3139394 RepID=UPI003BA91EF1
MFRSLLLIGCLFSFLLKAESYTVLSYHSANPPYSFVENKKVKGIFPDIFNRISELTGHQFNFVNFSVARGLNLFDQGKIDIEPGVNPLWRRHTKTPGIYSDFYASSREVVISKTRNQEKAPGDLYGKVLGVVRGYRYGSFEQHFAENKILKVDARSELELLTQINHGRIDYAIMGEATALYYQKVNHKIHLAPVMTVSELPVAMRLQPNLSSLQQELSRVLHEMSENGEIEKIYAKYGTKP